jgi:hypothetical protein
VTEPAAAAAAAAGLGWLVPAGGRRAHRVAALTSQVHPFSETGWARLACRPAAPAVWGWLYRDRAAAAAAACGSCARAAGPAPAGPAPDRPVARPAGGG